MTMLAASTRSTLPLSPEALAACQLRIPIHRADAPAGLSDFHGTRSRFAWHRALGLQPSPALAPEVLPSMPSHPAAIIARPVPLRPSPLPRMPSAEQGRQPAAGARRPYTDASFPWRCVCKVASGARSGSGVLIGPRHVLTAGHVLDRDAGIASVSFPRGGLVFAAAAVTDAITADAGDCAVIVLNQRLGDSLGFMGARTYDGDWDNETDAWCNIAYAPDTAGGALPVFQTGFFLEEDDPGRMRVAGAAAFGPGMCGSPVFGFWDGGPFVVGVAGAGDDSPATTVGGGRGLTDLVREARDRFA
ncbi:trypsin-like peptidase domain-containing protein [Inquilinus limosus]|uniref:trypsin-like serine peptidase n=1 Tax=Inquilinus limosus TaxID=171674 RepID=UPI003F15835F